MPLIFYYNEVGTEVLVINDLLIYCRPQFVLSSTKLPNKHVRFRHQWITGSRPVQ